MPPPNRPPPRMTGEPRLSVPVPPAAWRGPAGQVQRPPPPSRNKCGFCGRVRAWLITKVPRR